jgi:hypothetical protein
MDKRNNSAGPISNDELARRLLQRDKQVSTDLRQSTKKQAAPEALASRREPVEALQSWSLGRSLESGLESVSERERRALFAALSKGTKANLGREPTVAELVRLVDEVNRARTLVSSAQDAIQGRVGVYFDDTQLSFRGFMQSVVEKGTRTVSGNGNRGVA